MEYIKNSFAVVIVDMQDIFLVNIATEEKERLISSQIEVIEYCARINIPIAVLECCGLDEIIHNEAIHEATSGILKEKLQKVPRVKIIFKHQCDGFKNTDLENCLRQWNIETILLTGVFINSCLRKTGQGALERKFKIATADSLIGEEEYFPRDLWWFERVGKFAKDFFSVLSLIKGAA